MTELCKIYGDKERMCGSRKRQFMACSWLPSSFYLFLTLQSPEGTVRLSEGLRIWLEQFGIQSDFHSFRSNTHLVMYFVLGVVLTLYGRESGWKWWVIVLICCGIGVIDEGIKVLLPTREFDVTDLMRDFVGVVGVLVVMISKLLRKDVTDSGSKT